MVWPQSHIHVIMDRLPHIDSRTFVKVNVMSMAAAGPDMFVTSGGIREGKTASIFVHFHQITIM